MNKIIRVNEKDESLGEIGVLDAHLNEGIRHRAYTVILYNDQNEVLMTKRSLKKPLWPTFWDGSFSSHPRVGESLEQSCERRSLEELGIRTTQYQKVCKYIYQIRWSQFFSEHEVNHILKAVYNGQIIPNPEEVSTYKWMKWEDMTRWLTLEPEIFAPWWILAVEKMQSNPCEHIR